MDQAGRGADVDLPGSEPDFVESIEAPKVTGRLILSGISSTKENCLWTKLSKSSAIAMLNAKVVALKFLANLRS